VSIVIILAAERLFNLRFSERSGEKRQVETFVRFDRS